MRKHLKLISYALVTAALLISCYPNESTLYYSDLDVAVTNYDDAVDFDKVDVVFFLDTVMHIVDPDTDPKEGTYDKTIKRITKQNLVNVFGEDKVITISDTTDIPVGVTPDLVVTMSVLETDYYTYWSYPWYGYWGYWGWGWYYKSGQLKSAQQTDESNYYYDPYYPWYGGGSSYAYTIGSINIDLIDYKNADIEAGVLPVAWSGIVNGLANPSNNSSSRIETQINQCFSEAQSPYLY